MLQNLKFYFKDYYFITGVDEVGRGALAGPLLAGAVGLDQKKYQIVRKSEWGRKVNDSKKLSEKIRNDLSRAIRENLPHGIGLVSSAEIDSWGLTRANHVAIRRAMEKLPKANLIIGDGNLLVPRSFAEYRPIVKADQTVWLVAAASIIAKVERDNLMREHYHRQFPQYGFDKHVGYGTKYHRDAILEHGQCSIHRTCFKLI